MSHEIMHASGRPTARIVRNQQPNQHTTDSPSSIATVADNSCLFLHHHRVHLDIVIDVAMLNEFSTVQRSVKIELHKLQYKNSRIGFKCFFRVISFRVIFTSKMRELDEDIISSNIPIKENRNSCSFSLDRFVFSNKSRIFFCLIRYHVVRIVHIHRLARRN